jgi:hypothetical protein
MLKPIRATTPIQEKKILLSMVESLKRARRKEQIK